MKSVAKMIPAFLVGILVTYYGLNLQEEDLKYSITSPAKFGEINYQNIKIHNSGWNPAINIKIHINHPGIKYNNIRSESSLMRQINRNRGLATLQRIRRDEIVTLSLAYKGEILSGDNIKIVSDRSIARIVESETNSDELIPSWLYLFALYLFALIGMIFATVLIVGVATAIASASKESGASGSKKGGHGWFGALLPPKTDTSKPPKQAKRSE